MPHYVVNLINNQMEQHTTGIANSRDGKPLYAYIGILQCDFTGSKFIVNTENIHSTINNKSPKTGREYHRKKTTR